jgi:hypothetical protein
MIISWGYVSQALPVPGTTASTPVRHDKVLNTAFGPVTFYAVDTYGQNTTFTLGTVTSAPTRCSGCNPSRAPTG